MRLRVIFYTAAACLALAGALSAQEDILVQARALATSKRRPAALDLLDRYFVKHPDDPDARVLSGLILSWEGRFDDARQALQRVLGKHTAYFDAVLALINVELWSDHPERAVEIARGALEHHPDDAELLAAQAKALKRARQAQEEDNGKQVLPWQMSINHSGVWFSDHRAPWLEDQLSFRRASPKVSLILRLSHAQRFSSSSNLLEIESYPRIRRGTYGYVNLGFSPDANLYVRRRYGGEIFQMLPHGLEASAGARHMDFTKVKVNVFTSSLSKYYGNWFLTARTFITPDQAGSSHSLQLSVRHYYGDGTTDYLAFRYGRGASPFEIRSLNELGVLNSSSYFGEINWMIKKRLKFNVIAGISQEDRVDRIGLRQYVLDATFYYIF